MAERPILEQNILRAGLNKQACFDFGAQVIPGQDGRAAEALCWVGQRLFSVGLNGEITEYDLENLRPRYTVPAYGGPIWTISTNSQGTLLAVSQDLMNAVFTLHSMLKFIPQD